MSLDFSVLFVQLHWSNFEIRFLFLADFLLLYFSVSQALQTLQNAQNEDIF